MAAPDPDPQPHNPDLNTGLIIATFQSVRAEVQMIQTEYVNGQKYALLVTAAVFTWLFSQGATEGILAQIAWWIPAAVTGFIAVTAYMARLQIRDHADFIRARYARHFEAEEDCYDLFVLRERQRNRGYALRFMTLGVGYWVVLLAINIAIPILVLQNA